MSVARPAVQPSAEACLDDSGSGLLLLELEREARRIAERELRRRRGVFATLTPADREGIATVAQGVALRLAARLAAEAGRDPRLGRALAGPA